uniref:Alkaline ceramidase n=1 Tax=Arcella intermedia TaxID=1963864 RepID=A0A6B2LEL4_9EUKA
MSSIPIALVGLYGVICSFQYGYESRFFWTSFSIFFVGLGSMAFHGTLLYAGQAWDELGMIYGTVVFLYVIFEMETKHGQLKYGWLRYGLVAYCIVYSWVYLFFPNFFIIFVITYIGMVLYLSYKSYLIYSQPSTPKDAKHLLLIGVGTYVLVFFVMWLPDILLCHNTQWMNLHAWFHLGSAVGPYSIMTFLCFERHRRIHKEPKISYFQILGIIPLPYVQLLDIKVD